MAALLAATALLALPDAAGAIARPCPAFAPPETVGTVPDVPWFNEVSGLVASRTAPGVLWAISDSEPGPPVFGDDEFLVALEADGTELARYSLTGTTNVDWEDLALGAGPGGADHLYVADIGDNAVARASVTVYRVPEPAVAVGQGPVVEALSGAEAFTVTYPDGPHNAEALVHDPVSGDLFIATKANSGGSLYRVQLGAPSTVTEVASGYVQLPPGASGFEHQVTGADITADGSQILIRTYFDTFLFRRGPGQTVAEAVGGAACAPPLVDEPQGETVAFDADGGYFTLSERNLGLFPSLPPQPVTYVAPCEVPEPGAHGFPDVPALFDTPVSWLTCAGITTGYGDGTFRSGAGANRAQVAAYLFRFAGEPAVEDPPSFSDVPPSHPFAEEIAWLASEGITTGFADGTFRPQRAVTRGQIAAFLYRTADEPAVDGPPSFSDVAPSSPSADAIGWMDQHGIAGGFADGTYRPQRPVSRGALAAFLFRLATTDPAWG